MSSPRASRVAPCCDRRRTDLFGIACSVGCAVHCAAMPALIAAAPALGHSWLGGEAAHLVLLPLCAGAAGWAVRSGLRRHGRPAVAVLAAAGISLLAAPHLPGLFSDGGGAAACSSSCCGGASAPAAGVGPAAAFSRAVPLLTPLGGGLLVLTHLVNLFARPRTRRASVNELTQTARLPETPLISPA